MQRKLFKKQKNENFNEELNPLLLPIELTPRPITHIIKYNTNQDNIKELTLNYPYTTFTCSGDRSSKLYKRYLFCYPRIANFSKQSCLKFKFDDILDTSFSASQFIDNISVDIGGCRVENICFFENNICTSNTRRNVIINNPNDHSIRNDNNDKEIKTTTNVYFSNHNELIIPISILSFELNEYKRYLMPDSKYETRLTIEFKNYYCITSTTVLLPYLP